MRASTLGLVLLVAIAIGMACGGAGQSWEWKQNKKNDITSLYSQIGTFRRELGLDLEPHPNQILFEMKGGAPVKQVKAVCPGDLQVNETCADVCTLAESICDNAESICEIAAELQGDKWAEEKCASAKASCRQAKKKCCDKCSQAKATW
jgi:hypothetical protein